MKRTKLFSLLLALALLVSLLPAAALADSETADVDSWEALDTALQAGGSVRLTKDVTRPEIYERSLEVPGETEAALDLNGHKIDAAGTDTALTVKGSLTLSDGAGGGAITGAETGVYVDGGAFTMRGGAISGNSGRGVHVTGWFGAAGEVDGIGLFTMMGGEISGNGTAPDPEAHFDYAGGVVVMGETRQDDESPIAAAFVMLGGTISGNNLADPEAEALSAGVIVLRGGFSMMRGEIRENEMGVYVGYDDLLDEDDRGLARFAMTGGTISGGSADGDDYGLFGVYVRGGEFFLERSAAITGLLVGGVLIDGGRFEMTGGSILPGEGSFYGVFVGPYYTTIPEETEYEPSDFLMTGGRISMPGNIGVEVLGWAAGESYGASRSAFTMRGGEISDSRTGVAVISSAGADDDAAVSFVMENGKISGSEEVGVWIENSVFRMTGGEISGSGSWGVRVGDEVAGSGACVALSGAPVFDDNGKADVYLKTLENAGPMRIGVEGPLENETPIRVAVQDLPEKNGAPRVITEGLNGNGNETFFDSATDGYRVTLTDGGEAALARNGAYTVEVDTAITGGTVTAEPKTADAGDVVRLTVTANRGYTLRAGSLSVTGADDYAIELDADNRFVMPAGNVTVTARFRKNAVLSDDRSDDGPEATLSHSPGLEGTRIPVRLDRGTAAIDTLNESVVRRFAYDGAVSMDLTGLGSLSGFVYSGAAGAALSDAAGEGGRVTTWLREENIGTAAWYGVEEPAGALEQGAIVSIKWLKDEMLLTDKLNTLQQETLNGIRTEGLASFEPFEFVTTNLRGEALSLDGEKMNLFLAPETLDLGGDPHAYWLRDDGALEPVPLSLITGGKLTVAPGASITFARLELEHASIYLLSDGPLTEPEPCPRDENCPMAAFDDLDSAAWYHDGVHWALENGLMIGMGEGLFAPTAPVTRAMAVQMLWRLEGEPAAAADCAFEDVPADVWYAGAVAWAAETGCVLGVSETEFAPAAPVTREQLATLLYRYAQTKGLGFTGAWMFLLSYADRDEVSDWAYEAVCWMSMHEVMTGRENNLLAPKAGTTRAEIATLFQRFVPLTRTE